MNTDGPTPRPQTLEELEEAAEKGIRSGAGAWWAWYDQYLLSPEWRDLRERVFDRSDGRCEGCRNLNATQVHHLTYERVGAELLFDLVAVCDECHEKAHASRRRR